jgi:hypothetical protein
MKHTLLLIALLIGVPAASPLTARPQSLRFVATLDGAQAVTDAPGEVVTATTSAIEVSFNNALSEATFQLTVNGGVGVTRAQWPYYMPRMTKWTALLRRLKAISRGSRSQPIDRVIDQINPILSGWGNYFAISHASCCFSYVQDWVEKKIRRHLMRVLQREASAGRGGVGRGRIRIWACLGTTAFRDPSSYG